MSPAFFDLARIAPTPWKNGAGVTREIASCPAGAVDFEWRLSVAEVERDAPFSAFPGVDRCIVLLRGAGMRLRSGDGVIDHALTAPLAPFRFSGDVALDATLAEGACRDFNVMTRRGLFTSEVRVLHDTSALDPADVTMLLCIAGKWQVEDLSLTPMHGVLLPLPLGEGGGEGARRATPLAATETRFARPHPNPLPEGEGAIPSLLTVQLHRDPRP